MTGGVTEKPAGKLHPTSSQELTAQLVGSFTLSKGLLCPVIVTVFKTLSLGDLVNFRSFLCLTSCLLPVYYRPPFSSQRFRSG